MKVNRRQRTKKPAVVKRAISLPRDIDKHLHELAQEKHLSFSGVIHEAAEQLLKKEEYCRVHKAYARYYSKGESVKKDAELAQDFWRLSREN